MSIVVPCLGIISVGSLAFSTSRAGAFSENEKKEDGSDGISSPLESPQHDEHCISDREVSMLTTIIVGQYYMKLSSAILPLIMLGLALYK